MRGGVSIVVAVVLLLSAVNAGAQCPSTWRSNVPAYNVDCLSAAKPFACGGGDTGAPKCVAAGSIPSCSAGFHLSCNTCTCVADNTPTPAPGGGGAETCVTCTRSSATVYACSGLASIAKVRVGNTWQAVRASCGAGLNQVTVSGSTATFCYSVDAVFGEGTMSVQACGS